MKKTLIVFLFFFINVTCFSQKHTKDTLTKTTIISFIKWYLQNKDNLVEQPGRIIMEEGKPYRVNFTETSKYVNRLRKSEMLSELYLKELQHYFIRCDSNFVKYPQMFHVPHGFDFDLVLKSNDYDNVINNLNNAEIGSYKRVKNTVKITLDFIIKNSMSNLIESYTFQLSKHKGKWLIDKINGDFPTEIDHKEISWPK